MMTFAKCSLHPSLDNVTVLQSDAEKIPELEAVYAPAFCAFCAA